MRARQYMSWKNALTALELLLLAALLAAPWLAGLFNAPFWLDVATRLAILALAATGLNLLLGLGGLASFGHAAYLGIGAYATAIPVYHAIYGGAEWLATDSGLAHLALAVLASALFALITGALALRTRGIHFIMLTMAFAQMLFYLLQGLETYGGDDGLSLDARSQLPLLDLDNAAHMHWLATGMLLLGLALYALLARARFGLVLRGCKARAERMQALGWPVRRVLLAAYVLGGVLSGVAGWLSANHAAFVSPAMAEWTHSGELLFMVILGGAGRLLAPLTGAAAFVLLEELLSSVTLYWHLPFGLLLIGVALWQAGVLRLSVSRAERGAGS